MSVAINLMKVISNAPASDPDFIFTVETTLASETFTVPTILAASYDCDVFWGDTTSDTITTYNDAAWTHTYTSAGVYIITIKRIFTAMIFNNLGDKLKIKDISNWGNNIWDAIQERAYFGCANMTVTAVDVMNVSAVTSLERMFRECTVANPDVSGWDVSNVTDMSNMFREATSANPDVSGWDVSSAILINRMFLGATSANPDVSGWDVSSVTDMNRMFLGATSANPDVSGWDVSSATTLTLMFNGATSANPDVSGWDVSSVTDMAGMFLGATSFTQTNYDLLLIAWDLLTLQLSVLFSAGTTTYSAGAAATARASIISTYSWTITDGGQA